MARRLPGCLSLASGLDPQGVEVGARAAVAFSLPMNRRLIKRRDQEIWRLYNDPTQRLTVHQIGQRFGLSRRAVYHVVAKFARVEEKGSVR
jgi:hypothetical protein